jgi:hypothetical protein
MSIVAKRPGQEGADSENLPHTTSRTTSRTKRIRSSAPHAARSTSVSRPGHRKEQSIGACSDDLHGSRSGGCVSSKAPLARTGSVGVGRNAPSFMTKISGDRTTAIHDEDDGRPKDITSMIMPRHCPKSGGSCGHAGPDWFPRNRKHAAVGRTTPRHRPGALQRSKRTRLRSGCWQAIAILFGKTDKTETSRVQRSRAGRRRQWSDIACLNPERAQTARLNQRRGMRSRQYVLVILENRQPA